MNATITTDASVLMETLTQCMGGRLEGLRYDARVARSMLDKAKLEIDRIKTGSFPPTAEYQAELEQRLARLQAIADKAQDAVDAAEAQATQRRATEAQTATLSSIQVAYMIKTLGKLTAWLDGLNLLKPDQYDFHARILMRDEAAGLRDLLLNTSVHPISLTSN
jgi:hypothetical protein